MILHIGLPAYNLHDPVLLIGTWALLESLMWLSIHLGSERPLPAFAAVHGRIESAFGSLARRRSLAVAAIFLLTFFGRLALLPIYGVPPPEITDEFSQVLAADTFAHGRMTNPTHPMWPYFETFMENQRPTYHSMYPPGTGLFMAVAQVATGQPWYGMLFAVSAAAAAVCWMLQGWVPPRWALWGALIFVLHVAKNHLTEFYIGEGVAICGGALVLGAMPRIIKKHDLASSVWLGVGIALLATTRPYEGAVLVCGLALGGIFWALRGGLSAGTLWKSVALPVAMILLPVFLSVGYLNWRTTGNPLLAPYQLNLVQQHITRPFLWQPPASPAPAYDHPEMAAFYQQWEMGWWNSIQGYPRGVAVFLLTKLKVMFYIVIWPLTALIAIGSYQMLKDRRLRFLPLVLALFLAALTIETYQLLPWYAGPAKGLLLLLAVYGVRYIGVWKRKTHHGLRIARSATVFIPAAYLVCMVVSFIGSTYQMAHHYPVRYFTARQQLLKGLESLPGKQLVIVRYSATHIPLEEWVENRADIDSAKVVWARDVAERGNADLLQYFKDRTVWLLEPDGEIPKLTPYGANNLEATVQQVGGIRVSRCAPPGAVSQDTVPTAR